LIGSTLSHYRIVGELGRGGMGVVYKAEDTKLKRTVALKLLPLSTLGNEEDRARFFREAQAAAQLHHANIATVFAIEEAEPDERGQRQPFIAMEFIEGETLTERIARGPMKLREVVEIATQVALALEAAHEKNIVHRDIKSGNVMLTAKDAAKVLDFGLAKTSQSTKLTQLGSTLGTIAYMSPEQARGEEVDRRSDLWSLGVLMYEMVAGRLPFASEYEQAAVYSILNEEPEPLTSIRTGVPMGLEWIVLKLLAKNAKDRYQNVSDLLVDLRNVNLQPSGVSRITKPGASGPAAVATSSSAVQAPNAVGAPSGNGLIKYAIGAAVGAGLMLLAWMLLGSGSPDSSPQPTLRLTHALATSSVPPILDLSEDGTKLAYTADDLVHVLDLTNGESRALAGTENTVAIEFSADGMWLLLTKTLSVERIPVTGGTPVKIVDSNEGGPRANWGPDGWIIFEDNQNFYRYSESRSELVAVTAIDSTAGEEDVDWPSVLPDGKTVMGTLERGGEQPAQVRFWDFESGNVIKTINFSGYRVQYLSPGYLAGYVGNEGLVVVPFDIDRLEITGPRVPVVGNVDAVRFGISANGTLVYVDNVARNAGLVRSVPSILTYPAFKQHLPLEAGYYSNFYISPDEKKLAFLKWGGPFGLAGNAIWVLDLASGTSQAITEQNAGGVSRLAWMPGSDSVAYSRAEVPGGPNAFFVRAADGSGTEQLILSATSRRGDFDVSSDGKMFVVSVDAGGGRDLLRTFNRQTKERKTIDGADGSSTFEHVRISPDGIHVAVRRNESVYIERVDGGAVPYNFSRGFARYPIWTNGASPYLFMVSTSSGSIQKFDVTLGESPNFTGGGNELAVLGDDVPYFDVFDDGERAIVADLVGEPVAADSSSTSTVQLHVVVNWFSELRQK